MSNGDVGSVLVLLLVLGVAYWLAGRMNRAPRQVKAKRQQRGGWEIGFWVPFPWPFN